MTQQELDEAGIKLTPAQCAQATISTFCFIAIVLVALGAAVHHRLTTPAEKPEYVTQVQVENR